MTEDEIASVFGCGFFAGAAMVVIISSVVFWATVDNWKDSAVKHGAAHYNQTTGKWQWNDPEHGTARPSPSLPAERELAVPDVPGPADPQ